MVRYRLLVYFIPELASLSESLSLLSGRVNPVEHGWIILNHVVLSCGIGSGFGQFLSQIKKPVHSRLSTTFCVDTQQGLGFRKPDE